MLLANRCENSTGSSITSLVEEVGSNFGQKADMRGEDKGEKYCIKIMKVIVMHHMLCQCQRNRAEAGY